MKNILLLHGAIGSKRQFDLLKTELIPDFNVIAFNFPGHGGERIPDEGYSVKLFAESVINFLNENKIDKISIFGYSMGGYVGMYLSKYFPDRIEKLITLATKFLWSEETAKNEIQMLNAEKMETKIPTFVTELKKQHSPNDWRDVLNATRNFLFDMGVNTPLKENDFKNIDLPVLVMTGDKDKMVTMEETISIFKLLPASQLGILPDTTHPIESVNVKVLSSLLKEFLKK